jgi:hypothetical protein
MVCRTAVCGCSKWGKVGSKVRVRVLSKMQLKLFGDQRCVDFVSNSVWALKFPSEEAYRKFLSEFQDCLFENVETTVSTFFFFFFFFYEF